MKFKISLLALALAGALPAAALANPAGSKAPGSGDYGSHAATPAVPATPATPAMPASGGSAATPAVPATPAMPASPASRAEPREGVGAAPAAFRQLDKDHDGKLSKEEAQSMPDVQTRFAAMDTDHDGKISSAEWNMSR